jgi:D-sedoheptulose 7-phosphate isomerase
MMGSADATTSLPFPWWRVPSTADQRQRATQTGERAFQALVSRYPHLGPVRETFLAAHHLLVTTLAAGGRVLVCGNGGSAADADHIAGELAKRMVLPRPLPVAVRNRLVALGGDADGTYLAQRLEIGLDVHSLVSDGALATAIVNDMAADLVFAQQVAAYGRPGDLLWCLSTSGKSRNLVLAAYTARALEMEVFALTGPTGGPLAGVATLALRVPGDDVQAVQEHHLPIYHALCAALEAHFFAGVGRSDP